MTRCLWTAESRLSTCSLIQSLATLSVVQIVGTFASIAIDGKIGERKMRERIDELQDFA